MDLAYQVADLTTPEIDRAFPLAEAAKLATDLNEWRLYCQSIIDRHDQPDTAERLIVCANGRGYFKALCMTRLTQTEDGSVLDVPVHIIATIADENGVRQALQEGLLALAQKTGSTLHQPLAG